MESKSKLNTLNQLFLLIFSFYFLGCASKTIYYWNDYEPSLYSHFLENESPLKEIENLRKDESKASQERKPLPPGFYAYLGYLYSQVGNYDLASSSFTKEKSRFPESNVLMSRFLTKPKKR